VTMVSTRNVQHRLARGVTSECRFDLGATSQGQHCHLLQYFELKLVYWSFDYCCS